MTNPVIPSFRKINLDEISEWQGRIVVFIPADGRLSVGARRVNRLSKGALLRFVTSEAFSEMEVGTSKDLAWPVGHKAEAVQVIRLERNRNDAAARKAGAAIGAIGGSKDVLVLAGNQRGLADIALGTALRAYEFNDHKTGAKKPAGSVTFAVSKPEETTELPNTIAALASGVFFTRDLVNEPSNILTTSEFAARLEALKDLGVTVKTLDEPELEKLGMRTLLSVGHGSRSPSKVVIMEWLHGEKGAPPLALVGKGVVFDTGGISLKPAGGMEDMTMDMGGAGTVAGAMKTIAMRKAKANVVAIVGLVENMPDGQASRPGDVVRSMKGDTVEIINTDAEGRLV
ncbi:MAG TPA: leucyl aminopeptidase, partial [Armatimonadetes bacterium]|nr:leucyl aminopeptidase [Armatimonadota bacterium]